MRTELIDPREVILWHHLSTTPSISKLVLDLNWIYANKVCVFETPKSDESHGKYIAHDGHHRLVALMDHGRRIIPASVLETTGDISRILRFHSIPIEDVIQNCLSAFYQKSVNPLYMQRLNELRTKAYDNPNNIWRMCS